MRQSYNDTQKKYLKFKFMEYTMHKFSLPLIISLFFSFFFLTIFINEIIINIQNNLPIFSLKNILLLPLITFLFISIAHLISIISIGFKRINDDIFIIKRLNVKQKINKEFILSDNHIYKICGIKNIKKIEKEKQCDVIIITNNYGFILWEIIIPTPYKTNSILNKIKLEYLDITKLKN